jgi:2-iminobutanoate/2-iminopropanoate deaminase
MAREIIGTGVGGKSLAAYSPAVKAGGMVYVSGQGPTDPGTGDVIGTTIQEQTAQCLRNVQALLEAGGSSLDRVVWALFSLRHPEEFDGFNEEWARWFTREPPARHGAMLPLPERLAAIRISIGVIADAS